MDTFLVVTCDIDSAARFEYQNFVNLSGTETGLSRENLVNTMATDV